MVKLLFIEFRRMFQKSSGTSKIAKIHVTSRHAKIVKQEYFPETI